MKEKKSYRLTRIARVWLYISIFISIPMSMIAIILSILAIFGKQ